MVADFRSMVKSWAKPPSVTDPNDPVPFPTTRITMRAYCCGRTQPEYTGTRRGGAAYQVLNHEDHAEHEGGV
jgi:hypothetical protein